jgi:hypothetical protein
MDDQTKPSCGQLAGNHGRLLLLSIPGIGRVISATMIAEGADPPAQRDYHAL